MGLGPNHVAAYEQVPMLGQTGGPRAASWRGPPSSGLGAFQAPGEGVKREERARKGDNVRIAICGRD